MNDMDPFLVFHDIGFEPSRLPRPSYDRWTSSQVRWFYEGGKSRLRNGSAPGNNPYDIMRAYRRCQYAAEHFWAQGWRIADELLTAYAKRASIPLGHWEDDGGRIAA